MENYITHAYCLVGECEVWYGGSQLHFRKGDCMIVVANRQVMCLNPSADFHVRVRGFAKLAQGMNGGILEKKLYLCALLDNYAEQFIT